jgi:hypothetical protein
LDPGTRLYFDEEGVTTATRLRIDVTSAGLRMTKACRGRVRRRVLLELSRFGPELKRAAVHLSSRATRWAAPIRAAGSGLD